MSAQANRTLNPMRSVAHWAVIINSAVLLVLTIEIGSLSAGGWSSKIASTGKDVIEMGHWPKGTLDVLNDRTRADGWHDGFSEWPNDVVHYCFTVKETAELNQLLVKFGKIKSLELDIRLCPMKETRGLGWVTRLKEGNGTVAVFSIGHQEQIKQWYERLGPEKKFGQIEFAKMPEAVPPTMTIYVEHPAVVLDKLKIPVRCNIELGRPPLFKDMNMKPNLQKKKSSKPEETPTIKAIHNFIAQHNKRRNAADDSKPAK